MALIKVILLRYLNNNFLQILIFIRKFLLKNFLRIVLDFGKLM